VFGVVNVKVILSKRTYKIAFLPYTFQNGCDTTNEIPIKPITVFVNQETRQIAGYAIETNLGAFLALGSDD
jgi:hypothetical protein